MKGEPGEALFPHIDKIGHLCTFAILTFLFAKSFAVSKQVTILVLISYGALIEVLQGMTAYRQASLADLIADAIGVAVGLLLVYLTQRKNIRPSNTP
ncbi:VanZ family protein [Flocculibacter collagenilyticus]|uniref:VanZ family protein n=1 Tax=Flocculibacter collagenilyticus TaxID=2744479 RepID=UPI0018F3707B|nr:VanZ family protein [Flocculibacter collagenilyticus]